MFDNLTAWLDKRATPDQKAVMLRACRVLLEAGFADHEAFLEQEVIATIDQDEDLYLSLVREYMIPLYAARLGEFGIVVNPEAELPILSSMLEAVDRLDCWDDPAAINDLADDDEDPEPTLADILAVTGQDISQDYLNAIDSVSPDLIRSIYEITASQIDLAEEPESDKAIALRDAARNRVALYSGIIAADHRTLLDSYLNNQGRLGESVKIIVFPYYQQLMAMPHDQAAEEILALLSATSLPDGEMVRAAMGLVEQLGGDDELALGRIANSLAALNKKVIPNESV